MNSLQQEWNEWPLVRDEDGPQHREQRKLQQPLKRNLANEREIKWKKAENGRKPFHGIEIIRH